MLKLPAELRLMILRQLPSEDLLTLLAVNKDLKAFVHPLFYERMLFTRHGPAFPHAPNPYPFIDIPNLKVTTPVSNEERTSIAKSVRSITIAAHSFTACRGWLNIQTPHMPPKADVLAIELAYPSRDGVAECHKPVYCECCGDYAMGYDEDDECASHPYPECAFVDALNGIVVKKIVVKNYPALLNGAGLCLPKLAESVTDFVVVLKPHSLEDLRFCEGPYFADACPEDNLGATAIMRMIPPSVTDLTLVFWTDWPGRKWSPNCKHYNWEWYERGCSSPCPCGGGCHDGDSFLDEGDAQQQSCWQVAFWKKLARGIAASKARITIVNYSSIPPDGVNRYELLEARDGGKRPTVRKTFLRELRKAHKTKAEYEARVADVHLVSMESWLRSGAWEDVFNRKDVARWLERVEKQQEKAKSKAASEQKAAVPAETKEKTAAEAPASSNTSNPVAAATAA